MNDKKWRQWHSTPKSSISPTHAFGMYYTDTEQQVDTIYWFVINASYFSFVLSRVANPVCIKPIEMCRMDCYDTETKDLIFNWKMSVLSIALLCISWNLRLQGAHEQSILLFQTHFGLSSFICILINTLRHSINQKTMRFFPLYAIAYLWSWNYDDHSNDDMQMVNTRFYSVHCQLSHISSAQSNSNCAPLVHDLFSLSLSFLFISSEFHTLHAYMYKLIVIRIAKCRRG